MRAVRLILLATLLTACREADPFQPDFSNSEFDLLFEVRLGGRPALVLVDLAVLRQLPLFRLDMAVKDPAPSPDGRHIAFVSDRDGNDDIYVVNRDGTGLRQLTSDPATDDQPAWSPDGHKIAFRSFRGGGASDIWVMDASGANAVNVTGDSPAEDRDPAWSPDGQRIAYASATSPCVVAESELEQDWTEVFRCSTLRIWTRTADGSNPTRLTTATSQYEGMPAWSPDGRTIAFSLAASGGQDVAIYRLDGSGGRVLNMQGAQGMPAWTPFGDLLFVHQFDGTAPSHLFIIDGELTSPRLLVEVPVPLGSRNPAVLRRP